MELYCDGQADAFRRLYARIGGELYAYLRRLSGGDAALADDLLQITFLKVHRARGAYVRGANPIPWMYAIAHRTFIDEARRRKRARVRNDTGETPEGVANLHGQAEGETPPPEPSSELSKDLQDALEKLPAKQKEAIILTKLNGKTMAEAAEIAGTSPGAMKVRAHRGTQALKRLLGPQRKTA